MRSNHLGCLGLLLALLSVVTVAATAADAAKQPAPTVGATPAIQRSEEAPTVGSLKASQHPPEKTSSYEPAEQLLKDDLHLADKVSATSPPADPASKSQNVLSSIIRSRSSLSALWDQGVWPATPGAEISPSDEAAALLAGAVAKRDDESPGALLAALAASGVSIRRRDGSSFPTAQTSTPRLVIQEWQLAAMAKQYDNGVSIALAGVSAAIQRAFPGATLQETGALLLQDISVAADTGTGSVRFWARFVMELSRQSPLGIRSHLLEGANPAEVRLDPIQYTLILLQVINDASSLQRQEPSSGARIDPRDPKARGSATALLSRPPLSSWSTTLLSFALDLVIPAAQAASAKPCAFNDSESLVLSGYTAGADILLKTLVGYLATHGVTGVVGGMTAVGQVGAVLSGLEAFLMLFALDVSYKMDPDPLVRTKSTTSEGDRSMLTLTLKYNTESYQWVNCVKPALNLGGLDFDAEQAGGKAGSRIDWQLVEGSDLVRISPSLDHVTTTLYSDENGQSKIVVIGRVQPAEISEPANSIDKSAKVQTNITLEPKDPTQNKNYFLLEFLKGALGGLGGLAIKDMELMLKHTDTFLRPTVTFVVKDWEPNWTVVVQKIAERNDGCVFFRYRGLVRIPLRQAHLGSTTVMDQSPANQSNPDVTLYAATTIPITVERCGIAADCEGLDVLAAPYREAQCGGSGQILYMTAVKSAGPKNGVFGSVRLRFGHFEVDDRAASYMAMMTLDPDNEEDTEVGQSPCFDEMCTGFSLSLDQALKEGTPFPSRTFHRCRDYRCITYEVTLTKGP